MNGVHDMGGMHGLGPIEIDDEGRLFHSPAEERYYALNRALGAFRLTANIDARRYAIESLPAVDYLRMGYWERWVAPFFLIMIERGFITREEYETGKATPGFVKATPPLTEAAVRNPPPPAAPAAPAAPRPVENIPARFRAGRRVRTLNINPVGHTRLPRYARARAGRIVRDHGVYTFPDTNAHSLGQKRQHVYLVQFTAVELWGREAAPRDMVYLDLWEDYLEPA